MREELIKKFNDIDNYMYKNSYDNMLKIKDHIYNVMLEYEDFIEFMGMTFVTIDFHYDPMQSNEQADNLFYIITETTENIFDKKQNREAVVLFINRLFTPENSRLYTIHSIICS